MQSEQIAIAAKDLKKSHKKTPVLQGVSFTVRKGSIFALLGPNGAGKTTTINILSTLLRADAGEAAVAGFDVIRQDNEVRKQISLTGQFAAVDEILTGRENLVMIAELRHLKEPKELAAKLFKEFELEEAADRPMATYSGGMRRRVDIAMGLIGNPSIIILDEPTTGLDPQGRNTIWQIIRNLASSGKTVFLTTQYLEEADLLADHIAILSEGKVIAEGTPTELKKLLPGGHIVITFHDENDLKSAEALFKPYKAEVNRAQMSLDLASEGSVEQMVDILAILKTNSLDVMEFTQKLPTLDDVFLKIIADKKNGEEI